jgi:hypothetical protein
MATPPPITVLAGTELLRVTPIIAGGGPAGLDAQTTTQAIANLSPTSNTGLSGMTAGRVPIAATATTVTSSLPLSGTTGGTEVASATSAAKTSGHLATWDANGNLIDGGAVPAAPPAAANPTAVVGSAAVNGAAATFMRSDAAPALGTLASITLSEIAAPAAPLSGAILYVDSTSHLLSYVDSQGNRAVIT